MFAEKVPDHLKEEFLADAADKVTLHLALEASDAEMPDFVEHLRAELPTASIAIVAPDDLCDDLSDALATAGHPHPRGVELHSGGVGE